MASFFAKSVDTLMTEANDFFKAVPNGTAENIIELQEKFNKIYRQLQKAGIELNECKNLGYSTSVISAGNVALNYVGRGNGGTYDAYSGLIVNDIDDYPTKVDVDTKNGTTSFITGYVPELGAIVIREILYKIGATKTDIVPLREFLASLVGQDHESRTIEKDLRTGKTTRVSYYPCHLFRKSSAKDFLNLVYGTTQDINITYDQFISWSKRNKSFEIIWRTIKNKDDFQLLASREIKEAMPLNKLFNISKVEFDEINNEGLICDFITLYDRFLSKEDFFIQKTIPQWIKIMKVCKGWEEDLTFNNCKWTGYDPCSLLAKLLYVYVSGYNSSYGYSSVPYRPNLLSKNYSLMKFINYVVQGTQDQGFSSTSDFLNLLCDYLRMADMYKVKPTLYSSTLQVTHDILSRNHKIEVSPADEIKFKDRYKDFVDYKPANKKWIVIKPENTTDILKEGDYLNHCVFSYVKRIINGENLVVFLREKENPDIPLITVEIKNNAIVQARGMHNNSIAQEYIDFLTEYAKNSKMEISDML